ncbi:MAG: Hpt domain-containing protein [Bacteroidales bacterium]|nr:Hpt domain-containing protein [Bacteroidales bacterium]MCF8404171.1 Hpt domain-containing protein [Bacteroidales bacterium]
MDSKRLFDLTNLTEMLGDDKKAILQMVKIFLQATPESLNELNRCYEKNDLQGVSKLAHKLKSSIDIFSIKDIKQDIRRLENNTRDNINLDEVPELVERLNTVLSTAIKQVEEEKEILNKKLFLNEKA